MHVHSENRGFDFASSDQPIPSYDEPNRRRDPIKDPDGPGSPPRKPEPDLPRHPQDIPHQQVDDDTGGDRPK